MLSYLIPGLPALGMLIAIVVEARINSAKHKAEQARRQQHYGKYWH